jgi:hypothetical protein
VKINLIFGAAVLILFAACTNAAIIVSSSVVAPAFNNVICCDDPERTSLAYDLLITSKTGQTGTAFAGLNVIIQGVPEFTHFFGHGSDRVVAEGDAELGVTSSQGGGPFFYFVGAPGGFGVLCPLYNPGCAGAVGGPVDTSPITVPFTFGVHETIMLFADTKSHLEIDLPSGASLNGFAGEAINASVDFAGITGIYDNTLDLSNRSPFDTTNITIVLTPIPEPSSIWSLLIVLGGGALFKKRDPRLRKVAKR